MEARKEEVKEGGRKERIKGECRKEGREKVGGREGGR